ncbi:hypothetical protein DM860_016175 [Cuscuta australis]|uniref:F-box domain-containing protein n=1 Tax=Cuscuta australis TaxID=267555 RepID=A0A328E4F0_9ASTE|nr:hypothetical protein DM860_016175 [Cuscuta australis]
MLVECIAWVLASLHLLCSLRSKNKGLVHFPDDILIDVLSRLPADAIQQCRRVCRHWRTLTSSTYFNMLQSQRASSALVQVDMATLERSISKYEKEAHELKKETPIWWHWPTM